MSSLVDRTAASFRYVWPDEAGGKFNQSQWLTFEVAFTAGVSAEGQEKVSNLLKYVRSYILIKAAKY